MSDKEYWSVAALFEDPMEVIKESMAQQFGIKPEELIMPDLPPEMRRRWEIHTHEEEAKATAEIEMLRGAAASECTCGKCPTILGVQLAHVHIDKIDVGQAKTASTPEPPWWGEVFGG